MRNFDRISVGLSLSLNTKKKNNLYSIQTPIFLYRSGTITAKTPQITNGIREQQTQVHRWIIGEPAAACGRPRLIGNTLDIPEAKPYAYIHGGQVYIGIIIAGTRPF